VIATRQRECRHRDRQGVDSTTAAEAAARAREVKQTRCMRRNHRLNDYPAAVRHMRVKRKDYVYKSRSSSGRTTMVVLTPPRIRAGKNTNVRHSPFHAASYSLLPSKKRDGLGTFHPALRLQLSPHTAREEKPRDYSQALLVPLLICHCGHQSQKEVEELLGMRAGGRE
jgi:hypothetical protein